jgi:phosphoribulokinase
MMQGKRIIPIDENDLPRNPGEYMKREDGTWLLCLPNGIHGTIDNKIWNITEHEDMTISVVPSICVGVSADEKFNWHGFLTKGVWKEC